MWLLIPGIILGVVGLGILLVMRSGGKDSDAAAVIYVVGACFLLFSLIVCPCQYYSLRNEALRAETYYQQIALPHAVAEYEDYIEVLSPEAGLWQAGDMNLPNYNAYLRTTRYWDSVPIIGSVVFGPPEYLKFVRVGR